MAIRLRSLAVRITVPLAVVGVTAIGAASPAHAEPDPLVAPTIEISVPERVVTTAGGSKTVPFEVVNAGATPATGLVVDFAAAVPPIDPRLGFLPPTGCTAAGCAVGDLAPGARKSYTFTVKPAATLPEAGASFTLTAHDAGAGWKTSSTVTVVRAKQGIDLETAAIPDIKLAAGKSAALPIAVRNNGDKASPGVAIAMAGPKYIKFSENYSNCVAVEALRGVVCAFDKVLDPGVVFALSPSTPLTVAADAAAPGPADYQSALYAFGLDDETKKDANLAAAAAVEAAKKPGNKLQLVPAVQTLAAAENELNEWDNSISFLVKVALNPADSVAIGDTFEGKVGGISAVRIGFRNAGPASLLGKTKEWVYSAAVRTPSGLALTKVDRRCVPNGADKPRWSKAGQVSGRDYLCVAAKPLAPGEQELFSFYGKIQNGENADAGRIEVRGGVQDRNTTNNAAKVDVKVTVVAESGGAGGGAGGGLAITGAPAGRVAGLGLLLVLTGALALVLTRRRVV